MAINPHEWHALHFLSCQIEPVTVDMCSPGALGAIRLFEHLVERGFANVTLGQGYTINSRGAAELGITVQ